MIRASKFLVRLIRDSKGQDMVEYALLAGFIAVSAGALLPGVSDSVSTIFSRMNSVLTEASGGGGNSPASAPTR
jgi:pilus assembly protein Flp/PilA